MKDKIKNILSNKTLVTFIAGALFVMLFLRQCNQISNLKQDVKFAQEDADRSLNNYKAAQDSVKVLRNENGDQLAEIRSFEFDLSQLEESQKNLTRRYQKALALNKDLKEVNSLISAELEIKDSLDVSTTTETIDTTTTRITFNSEKDFGNGNSRILSGFSTVKYDFGKFEVLNTQFELKQTLSLMAAIEAGEDGADRLKLSTSYPGLVIRDIENINLVNTRLNRKAEKKSRWLIGFGVGYGVNLNNNQVISTGPSLGVGLYWSPKFLQF
tara:strand:- start:3833 stop:4642 length:810 start_codon:yes stop_codon:yes gene_type:complete